MTILKNPFLAIACGIFAIAAGECAGAQAGLDTAEANTTQQVTDEVYGRYTLIAVNGKKVPAIISHRGAKLKVHAGDFTIRADGNCSTTSVFTPPSGGKVTRKVHATYTKKDSKIVMEWQGAGMTTGTITGKTFTMDNHGMLFVYSRSGPVDDSLQPYIGGVCDERTGVPDVRKAQAGVFDDFNSDLITGIDPGGRPIGYFTFRDSDSSTVTISAASEHPPLPNEAAGNAVLQLDLNVKAWAGVIHSFEDPAVSRWTPQDWRGFSSFSFWLYGRDSNTTLYVEILDNRKPCPESDGAELFAYLFTDNFSGWKKIVVPFAKLTRKETHNNAPNDGLGLAEVHGWAFGALNTGGPVTYYLDNFELR